MIKNRQVPVSGIPIRYQILETLDTSGFSEQLKEDFKNQFLPLLKKLVPEGGNLEMVFLSDPPGIEIRKIIR